MKKTMIVMAVVVGLLMSGCAHREARYECKSTAYQYCYQQMKDNAIDKTTFKICWRNEYYRCLQEKGYFKP